MSRKREITDAPGQRTGDLRQSQSAQEISEQRSRDVLLLGLLGVRLFASEFHGLDELLDALKQFLTTLRGQRARVLDCVPVSDDDVFCDQLGLRKRH